MWLCSGVYKEVGSLFFVTSSCVFPLGGALFIRSEDGCAAEFAALREKKPSCIVTNTLFLQDLALVFSSRPNKSQATFRSTPLCIHWTQPFPVLVFKSKLIELFNVNRKLAAGVASGGGG